MVWTHGPEQQTSFGNNVRYSDFIVIPKKEGELLSICYLGVYIRCVSCRRGINHSPWKVLQVKPIYVNYDWPKRNETNQAVVCKLNQIRRLFFTNINNESFGISSLCIGQKLHDTLRKKKMFTAS